MPSITVEFHADPQEIKTLMTEAAGKHNLHIVSFEGQPFRVNLISIEEFLKAPIDDDVINRFFLCVYSPNLKVSSHGELRDLNPDLIRLDIGKLSSNSLKESSLVVDTQDELVLKTTKAIAKAIKKVAQAGAGYTSPGEESLGWDRNHRHTQKARDLYAQGIKMLPVAGAIEYVLDAPKPTRQTKKTV